MWLKINILVLTKTVGCFLEIIYRQSKPSNSMGLLKVPQSLELTVLEKVGTFESLDVNGKKTRENIRKTKETQLFWCLGT